MSDNKPPMTVWLTGKQTPCEATNKKHDVFSPHGPYVHLEQFLKEVERLAWLHPKIQSYEISFEKAMEWAIEELAKEITEGKA